MATISKYETSLVQRFTVSGTGRPRIAGRRTSAGSRPSGTPSGSRARVEIAKMRGRVCRAVAGAGHGGGVGPGVAGATKGHMKPSGFRSYESAWRVHVEPRWRAAKVSEIRYTDVQAWVASCPSELECVAGDHRLLGAGADPRRRCARPGARGEPGPRCEAAHARRSVRTCT